MRDAAPELGEDMDYVERNMFEQLKMFIELSLVRFKFDISPWKEVSPRWFAMVEKVWNNPM